LKQRIRDQYIQNWKIEIHNVAKFEYFKQFKVDFCYEKYLDILTNSKHRELYTIFRISPHNLEIEVGRYTCNMKEDKIVTICNHHNQLHLSTIFYYAVINIMIYDRIIFQIMLGLQSKSS
jgi:hypothetical protein